MTFLEQVQQILTLIGSIFSVVGVPILILMFYSKDKQKDGDKIAHIKELDIILGAKVEILKQGLESEMKSLATVMGAKIEGLINAFVDIKKNDLHSIYEKQRDQDSQINKLTVSIEKIDTKLDERVPKKIS